METNQTPPDSRRTRRAAAAPIPERLPPFSVEAERGVLGCLILNAREAHIPCVEKLSEGSDVFYDQRHRPIYEAIMAMVDAGRPVDLLTLRQSLSDAGRMEDAGGTAYLASLPDAVPSAVNIGYYVDIVAEKYMLRRMVAVCTATVGKIYEYDGKADDLVDHFEEEALSIRRMPSIGEVDVREALKRGVDMMDEAHRNPGMMWGIPSGFLDLDRMTKGFRNGNMITIAARPSVGKTSYAMNIAEHVAVNLKLPVGIFSLEMGGDELVFRAVCSRARVSSESAMEGRMAERDFPRIMNSQGAWRNAPVHIVDRGGMSIAQIRAHARRMAQRHGIRLFVVDYLQLISATIGRNENRVTEVTRISNGIKSMAKELNVPVIVLSQLNRETERFKRPPQLSDLRDSGCLAGETMIYGPRDSRIDSLSAGDGVYSAAGLDSPTSIENVSAAWRSGEREAFEMTLCSGHKLLATSNHKFLKEPGWWVPLGDLSPGHRIAIPIEMPLPVEATISMAEARLMGLFLSNGCSLSSRAIQITLNDKDGDLERIASKDAIDIFGGGVSPHSIRETYRQKDHARVVFFPSTRKVSRRHRNPIAEWLRDFGMWDVRARDKKIPAEIFRQPRGVVCEFLKAIFAGDGTVSGGRSKKFKLTIAYSSTSPNLVSGIQRLLQHVGILSSVSHINSGGHQWWTLQIYSRIGKMRFAKEIGFLSERKSSKMNELVKIMAGRKPGWSKYLVSGPLAFVPIKSITPIGVIPVYDASVPATECFVANGILAHNSIEQDSDVVILLHRENEDTNNPVWTIAANVAKQRNGRTGMLKFTFFREFTRFESASRVAQEEP